MGQVPAANKGPVSRRRRRFNLNLRPVLAVVIFAPAAIAAPDDFLRAAAVGGVIVASWLYGYHEGRADLARDLIMRSR